MFVSVAMESKFKKTEYTHTMGKKLNKYRVLQPSKLSKLLGDPPLGGWLTIF